MPYQSPLLERPGAVAAEAPDAGVAAHYGQLVPEQRRLLRESGAAVDLSHREVIAVSGEDRASWLTTLSTQVLTGLPDGASTELALLSPQGRIEYLAHAVLGAECVWLVVEAGLGQGLAGFLESMRFMLRVEVQDLTERWAVLGSVHDLRGLGGVPEDAVVWEDPWPRIGAGGTTYAAADPHPGADWSWRETLVPRAGLAGLDLAWCGVWAAEALRIEAWRPRQATEADERSIPHELDLLRTAVHLEKGCYKGQETVARVHNLGHPPRRLVFLDLDGSEHTLPARGATVLAGTKKVGSLTSVAFHHEAGPVALAVVKRSTDPRADLVVRDEGSAAEASTQQAADGTPAAVEYAAAQTVVVSPEAGQAVGRRTRSDFLR